MERLGPDAVVLAAVVFAGRSSWLRYTVESANPSDRIKILVRAENGNHDVESICSLEAARY